MKRFLVTLTLAAAICGVANAENIPLKNWAVPSPAGHLSALGDISAPVPFIAMAPCRIADTRTGGGFSGSFGPPSIAGSATARTFPILSSTCGSTIPSGVAAYSLSFTAVAPGSAPLGSFVTAFPTGTTRPTVSSLNFGGTGVTQVIASAAIVPAGSGSSIDVFANSTTDILIDINGYFSATPEVGTDGFHIYVNTSQYAGYFVNADPTCNGTCGVYANAASNNNGVIALQGAASSVTGYNYGVEGTASGVGGTFNAGAPTTLISGYSAGVLGSASAGTGNVAGIWGKTSSSGSYAAGVVGTATTSGADAGFFQNSGAGIYVHLGTGAYGLTTNGAIAGTAISGSSLSISGLPKNFVAPHPLDPSKEIVYAAIEGPSADVFYRGTAHLVNGSALIQVPEHFRLTAREDSYMTTVTAVGARTILWVESEGPDGIVVRGTGDAVFHYVVYAERDETRDQQPVRDNVHFTPEALSGKAGILLSLPERTRALLVKNGVLNPDMTINKRTAERLGWRVPAEATAN